MPLFKSTLVLLYYIIGVVIVGEGDGGGGCQLITVDGWLMLMTLLLFDMFANGILYLSSICHMNVTGAISSSMLLLGGIFCSAKT